MDRRESGGLIEDYNVVAAGIVEQGSTATSCQPSESFEFVIVIVVSAGIVQYTVGIDMYIVMFIFGGADYEEVTGKLEFFTTSEIFLISGVMAIDAPALRVPSWILLETKACMGCLRGVVFLHSPGAGAACCVVELKHRRDV